MVVVVVDQQRALATVLVEVMVVLVVVAVLEVALLLGLLAILQAVILEVMANPLGTMSMHMVTLEPVVAEPQELPPSIVMAFHGLMVSMVFHTPSGALA